MNRTVIPSAVIVILFLSGLFFPAKTFSRMYDHKENHPDTISFPLLVEERGEGSERCETFIHSIGKSDTRAGAELFYADGAAIVGPDDIFLIYEGSAHYADNILGTNDDGLLIAVEGRGSRTKSVLRFAPVGDGTYDISSMFTMHMWWHGGGGAAHADPTGIWERHGNSSNGNNVGLMRIFDLYNNYIATGRVNSR